jgi:hypothetical protein
MQVPYLVSMCETVRTRILQSVAVTGVISGVAVSANPTIPTCVAMLLLSALTMYPSINAWQRCQCEVKAADSETQSRVSLSLKLHGWSTWWFKPGLTLSVSIATGCLFMLSLG